MRIKTAIEVSPRAVRGGKKHQLNTATQLPDEYRLTPTLISNSCPTTTSSCVFAKPKLRSSVAGDGVGVKPLLVKPDISRRAPLTDALGTAALSLC